MWKSLVLAAALAVAGGAHAQTKKELVLKVLQLQQPSIENMARALTERPAAMLMQQAGIALQKMPADKRDAVAREIEADVRKYVDESAPIVREHALKLAPTTIGAVLEEKFNEDELKQLAALLESPVLKKYQQLTGEMQRSLGEKLSAELGPTIDPKVRALEQSITRRLGVTARPAPTGSAPAKK
jgi:hypothetical protein